MRRLCAVSMIGFALSFGPAMAEMIRDLERELRYLSEGKQIDLAIPKADNRVAVFTYEDPDQTGLGNALASLVATQILYQNDTTSIGVLRYEGGLSPAASEALSYFDRVERVTDAQKVTLAVWGAIRRSPEGLVIDTFVQIPPKQLERSFRWTVQLPATMKGDSLVAHLRPDRILAQHLEVPASAESLIRTAARVGDELRDQPRFDAKVRATLPVGSVYHVEHSKGDWNYVADSAGHEGWVPSRGACTGDCAALLDSASFVSGLLRYMHSKVVPEEMSTLGDDARDVVMQIRIARALESERSEDLPAAFSKAGGTARDATFANLRAMAEVAIELKRRAREPGEPLTFDKRRILEIAFGLARASQLDPRNTDLLHNLAVLFAYGGDDERAHLAQSLATAD